MNCFKIIGFERSLRKLHYLNKTTEHFLKSANVLILLGHRYQSTCFLYAAPLYFTKNWNADGFHQQSKQLPGPQNRSSFSACNTWCGTHIFAYDSSQRLLPLQSSRLQYTQQRNYTFFDLCRQLGTVQAAEPSRSDANGPVIDFAASTTTATDIAASTTTATDIAASTTTSTDIAANITPADSIEYIPLPPAILPEGVDLATLNALGEPTLSSLGLGGWSPIGMLQSLLELLHVSLGLPWWGAIAMVTVMIRVALFPLVVLAQRNATKLNNVSPQMQVLQMKMTDARNSGDQLMVSRYTQELVMFMKEKNVNPVKSMLVPLAQAPVFISMFMGLRRCADLPVLSMTTGGMLWFSDLTVPDPYYLLPVLTCGTMFFTIQLGTEVGRIQAAGENARLMFTAMRFMPLIIFPFMINFSGAVLCYWVTTNFISLGQAGLLRIPACRAFFNIPVMIQHSPDSLPLTKQQSNKSTVQAAKDAWRNMRVSREVQDRERYDEVRFSRAGTGPIVRTFKHDPTKPRTTSPASIKPFPPTVTVKAKVKN